MVRDRRVARRDPRNHGEPVFQWAHLRRALKGEGEKRMGEIRTNKNNNKKTVCVCEGERTAKKRDGTRYKRMSIYISTKDTHKGHQPRGKQSADAPAPTKKNEQKKRNQPDQTSGSAIAGIEANYK